MSLSKHDLTYVSALILIHWKRYVMINRSSRTLACLKKPAVFHVATAETKRGSFREEARQRYTSTIQHPTLLQVSYMVAEMETCWRVLVEDNDKQADGFNDSSML